MKRYFLALLLALPLAVMAQGPILRNAATTNSTPKLPNVLPDNTTALFPIMVLNPDGTGADRTIYFKSGFSITTSNTTLPGLLSLNGRTNVLSVVTNTLLLDGVAIGGSTSTNYYSTIVTTNLTVLNQLTVSNISVTNITVQNNLTVSNLYTVNGNHNTLIVTNAVRMPWTTLTMTGTNVAQVDLNAGSMFRVYLGANAFFGAVANHPGTNTSQTIQVALIQDGTGTRNVTMTNSTWFLSGSGATTNAMPVLNTNANALSLLTFVTSPTNAAHLLGVPTTIAP